MSFPPKPSRHGQLDIIYTINVVQYPIRARCCGFGEKDRRPIDPPPILELCAEDSHGNRIDLTPEDSTFFIVQCELYNVDKSENRTLVHTPWSLVESFVKDKNLESSSSNSARKSMGKPDYVKNLLGCSVSNAYHLYDEKNQSRTYFIFHDLSVRTEGIFTLKFIFFNLAATGNSLNTAASIEQEVFTTPFQVYTAKKFPGLTESTSLSRCFSKQGIKIPIRSESHSKQMSFESISEGYQSDQQDRNISEKEQSNSTNHPKYTRVSISDLLLPEE